MRLLTCQICIFNTGVMNFSPTPGHINGNEIISMVILSLLHFLGKYAYSVLLNPLSLPRNNMNTLFDRQCHWNIVNSLTKHWTKKENNLFVLWLTGSFRIITLLSYDVVSESVIKPCIKNVVTLCVDVHKNIAFSNGEIMTFWCKKWK